MSRVGNFRPLPGKWRPRWRSYQTASKQQQQQQQQQSGGFEIPGGGTGGGGRTGSEKGKLKFKAIWSWQAGAGWTIFSVLDWWLLAAGGWLTWRGVFLRWTPLGMCVAAAIQWHMHNKNLDRNGLPRTAAPWQVSGTESLRPRRASHILPVYTDAGLLFTTPTVDVTRLGLASRLSCPHTHPTHRLWTLLDSVRRQHRGGGVQRFQVCSHCIRCRLEI
jgi:hypothetical protein